MNTDKKLDFKCNICGANNSTYRSDIGREIQSCACGSTVRVRSLVHLLSIALFGESIPIPDFPENLNINGVGLSDTYPLDEKFLGKITYTNTFYHCEPLLDITAPKPERYGTCDFIISSDVFEHVLPPVSLAFDGSKKILKPNGSLILTVPWVFEKTIEHYPSLHDFRVVEFEGKYLIIEQSRDGTFSIHEDPIFHGGPGSTLEFRLFGKEDLLSLLDQTGFDAKIMDQDAPEWGILHSDMWSLPILAKSRN